MGHRVGSLLASVTALFLASTLYAGCSLDLDGTATLIDADASDDVFQPPLPDGGNIDATGDAAPRTCSDTLQDGEETDIDCGGVQCPTRCAIGQHCKVASDCQSKSCDDVMKICRSPSCTDMAQNGTETDVDCGGTCTTKCGDGKGCATGPDCQSNVCNAGKCAAPTCTDVAKNGTETDVDCGGSCPSCANQKACKVAGDCQSGHCQGMVCVAASCTDTVKNGSETDVDCGGSQCGPCGTGKVCGVTTDCQSKVCTTGTCRAPTCTDTTKNGNETDVDCGGGTCGGCATGKVCGVGGDCASGVCNANVCSAPGCGDGVKNGTETDVDCGGTTCAAKCQFNQGCAIGGDCRGGVCTAMKCAATCTDGAKNGNESDIDCGGGTCAMCIDGKVCVVQGDCLAGSFCNGTGHCAPKQLLGTGCGSGVACGSGNCVDSTCCNLTQAMCNGCKACNLGGGMCANVPGGSDPHNACTANVANCKSDNCFGDGTCNVADNTGCGASSCNSGTETDHTCIGGSCTAPTKLCTPYICGASACATTCVNDAGCIATSYCDQAGLCQPRKATGATCNTSTDCKVAGCRECGSGSVGGCVDGFCCNAACGGACQACSIAQGATANGTCAGLTGTVGRPSCSPLVCGGGPGCPAGCGTDTDCVAGFFCNAGGACQAIKLQGGTCNLAAGADCKVAGCRECGVNPCADGFCCNSACSGSCQACSIALGATTNGTCGTFVAGSAGRPPTCAPFVCNGATSCPMACTGDTDCATGFYCDGGGACTAQKALLDPCDPVLDCKQANCRECPLLCVAGSCT